MHAIKNLTNQLSNCNDIVAYKELIPLILMSLSPSLSFFASSIKATLQHLTLTLTQTFTLLNDKEMIQKFRSNRIDVSTESLLVSTQ